MSPRPIRCAASLATPPRSFLKTIKGTLVLVGHSYGGMVITQAADGQANVKALVYVDGFAPEPGESGLI